MGFFRKNNSLITYTLDKGFNRNLAISVQNGQVAVSAPWYVSKRKINQIIFEKKQWIIEKLAEYETKNYTEKSQKFIKVFGENYDLNVSYKLIKSPELYLDRKIIKIELPSKYKNCDNTKIIELIIEKFYKKMAEKEIEQLMEKMRIKLGIAPDDYKIQKIGKKLGYFDEQTKEIIINPEIIKLDKEILEYVVLHEFCHLRYKTHCKSFYKILSQNMKSYKEVEQRIKGMF